MQNISLIISLLHVEMIIFGYAGLNKIFKINFFLLSLMWLIIRTLKITYVAQIIFLSDSVLVQFFHVAISPLLCHFLFSATRQGDSGVLPTPQTLFWNGVEQGGRQRPGPFLRSTRRYLTCFLFLNFPFSSQLDHIQSGRRQYSLSACLPKLLFIPHLSI